MKNIISTVKNNVSSKSYYLAKFSFMVWRTLKFQGKLPIVIYQMGKVGSTSLLYSLQQLNQGFQIYQTHFISTQGIQRLEQMYWGSTPRLFRKSLLPETEHVYVSHFLHQQWNKKTNDQKWMFITLVRDPIARNISEFFYSVDTIKDDPYLPNFYKLWQSHDLQLPDLIEIFQSRFRPDSYDFSLPLNWFDAEFKHVLNVDVYSREFPRMKGFQIIQSELADILIIKLEKLQACYQDAFREFLNLNEFVLLTANTAGQKKYYPIYKDFIQNVNLPNKYIDQMYDTKFMKHFYTEEEIDGFRKKWQN